MPNAIDPRYETCLKELAQWFYSHRMDMTMSEMTQIASRHFTGEELERFYDWISEDPTGLDTFLKHMRAEALRTGLISEAVQRLMTRARELAQQGKGFWEIQRVLDLSPNEMYNVWKLLKAEGLVEKPDKQRLTLHDRAMHLLKQERIRKTASPEEAAYIMTMAQDFPTEIRVQMLSDLTNYPLFDAIAMWTEPVPVALSAYEPRVHNIARIIIERYESQSPEVGAPALEGWGEPFLFRGLKFREHSGGIGLQVYHPEQRKWYDIEGLNWKSSKSYYSVVLDVGLWRDRSYFGSIKFPEPPL